MTYALVGLLLLGVLWAFYTGDQQGRVGENSTAFTVDTRDPDSVVKALSLAQGEDSSTNFTIDTREPDSAVKSQSLAQTKETSTNFTIDTRDPDSVTKLVSIAVSEDSPSFTIDTRSSDPPTWGETSVAFVIDTRDPDSVVFALSIAQSEELTLLVIDTRDPLPLDSDNDGIHDFWEQMHFAGIFAQGASGDPDGDGLSNFAEFAFGTDPNEHDDVANGPDSINVEIRLEQVAGAWVVTLSYPRHVLAARSINYAYETAPNAGGPWADTTLNWTEAGDPVSLNGYVERVTIKRTLAARPAAFFARIQATRK